MSMSEFYKNMETTERKSCVKMENRCRTYEDSLNKLEVVNKYVSDSKSQTLGKVTL